MVNINKLNVGNIMLITEGSVLASHEETWYKYENDTEWRHVNIEGTLKLVDMGQPTGQIETPYDIVAIEIGENVTDIGEYAFDEIARLTSITIPGNMTSIGSSAFYGCSGLTSVTIPDSVTSIGDAAFSICSGLTNVTIGNSVTNIGASSFGGCRSLTSVTIPNSVTSIGEEAFYGCSGLTNVTFLGKTMEQVQEMDNYNNWGIDTSIISVA